jgi:hypothetical protein
MPTGMVTVSVRNNPYGRFSFWVQPETGPGKINAIPKLNVHGYAFASGICFQSVV